MNDKNNKIYFIGDIHGCVKTMTYMIEEKLQPANNDTLVFLGDYIDRGPNSYGVIKKLIRYKKNKDFKTVFLRGNHEQLLLDAVVNKNNMDIWFQNEGQITLKSYGVKSPDKIHDKHIKFINSTEYYYINDDIIAVHGGLNFKIRNPLEDKDAMLWHRNSVVYPEQTGHRKMIVGHTQVSLKTAKQSLNTNLIMLDGGCAKGSKKSYPGILIAYESSTNELYTVENRDEQI